MSDAPAPSGPAVQATFCATLVDEWARCGVEHAVVAPGSRSTPLALALAADDRITVHVHHDERAAGFMALGIGKASGRPAIVVTTSGTAAVELHPAVVEAHHDRVPLLVCTADRPPELRDVGAPQTVDQQVLYGTAVRWFQDPGVAESASAFSWRSLAGRAVLEAIGSPCGPVHLNLPFREPLVGEVGDLPAGRDHGAPWHERLAVRAVPDVATFERLATLTSATPGVIVAGTGIDDPGAVLDLARCLGWPVLADPRSGCRTTDAVVVAHADAIARSAPRGFAPEVVLRFGSWPASKLLPRWLTGIGAVQVLVDPDGAWLDPEHTVDLLVGASAGAVATGLTACGPERAPSSWLEGWIDADRGIDERITELAASGEQVNEPAVARELVAALPDGATLVVSSSMPIRDVEWFSAGRDGITVLANRGANGIDGVVSTAVGVALAGGPTAVLVGDVALLHDTNALLGLTDRPVDLTIVVIDNRGGGIFSFLPQAESLEAERFELLFGTPHEVDLSSLAVAHGVLSHPVGGRSDLVAAVTTSMAEGGVRLLVVRTERATNVVVHQQIHEAIAELLADR